VDIVAGHVGHMTATWKRDSCSKIVIKWIG